MVAHNFSSEQIENRKQENPDQIDEVPEQSCHFDAVRVALRLGLPPAPAGEKEVSHYYRASEYMRRVQAGKREIDREVSVVLRDVSGEVNEVTQLDRVGLVFVCLGLLALFVLLLRRVGNELNCLNFLVLQFLQAPETRVALNVTGDLQKARFRKLFG